MSNARSSQSARSATAAGGKPAAPHRGAGEIRIVGGAWKRTRLAVPDRPGLRPTPDRVRETLFNWLGQDLAGWRVLDVFAGTGALGIEAASRGAAQVTLVEQDAVLVARLQQIRGKLEGAADILQVRRGDGLAALRQAPAGSLDLVLIDPPFEASLFDAALAATAPALSTGGFAYLEAPSAWTAEALAPLGLELHRHLRAGAVHAHLLRRISGSP